MRYYKATVIGLFLFACLALVQIGCGTSSDQPADIKTSSGNLTYELQNMKLYYDTGKLYYEGQVRPGKWGTIHHAGNWIPYGKGKMYYFEGGLYYDGEVVDGWRHGVGKTYATSGILDYSGEWRNDSPLVKQFKTGIHTVYYADKKTKFYEGQWENGIREGRGVTYYRNGIIEHEGGYKDGWREGYGKYYNRDGSICYVGLFSKGVPCGNGQIYNNNKWHKLNDQYQIDYKALAEELLSELQGN